MSLVQYQDHHNIILGYLKFIKMKLICFKPLLILIVRSALHLIFFAFIFYFVQIFPYFKIRLQFFQQFEYLFWHNQQSYYNFFGLSSRVFSFLFKSKHYYYFIFCLLIFYYYSSSFFLINALLEIIFYSELNFLKKKNYTHVIPKIFVSKRMVENH